MFNMCILLLSVMLMWCVSIGRSKVGFSHPRPHVFSLIKFFFFF